MGIWMIIKVRRERVFLHRAPLVVILGADKMMMRLEVLRVLHSQVRLARRRLIKFFFTFVVFFFFFEKRWRRSVCLWWMTNNMLEDILIADRFATLKVVKTRMAHAARCAAANLAYSIYWYIDVEVPSCKVAFECDLKIVLCINSSL